MNREKMPKTKYSGISIPTDMIKKIQKRLEVERPFGTPTEFIKEAIIEKLGSEKA